MGSFGTGAFGKDNFGGGNFGKGPFGVSNPNVSSNGIDANAVTMLHFDGTDTSTTITDSALTPLTWTARADAQIDTAQSVFGGASLLCDGTGDYVDTPDNAVFDFSGGNKYTFDFRVRFNSLSPVAGYQYLFGQGTDAQNANYMYVNNDGSGQYSILTANVVTVNLNFLAGTFTINTWYHIAVIRGWNGNANDWALTKDGTAIKTISGNASNPVNYTGNFSVGTVLTDAGKELNGWIDEFRASNVARWTATFTPPSVAYAT